MNTKDENIIRLFWKVLFIGNTKVGKTQLIGRLLGEPFAQKYTHTTLPVMETPQVVSNDTISMRLWEVPAIVRSDTSEYKRDVDQICLVFDPSKLETITNLEQHFYRYQRELHNKKFVVTLIGTRCDEGSEMNEPSAKEAIHALSKMIEDNGYDVECFYVSSKTNSGIDDVSRSIEQHAVVIKTQKRIEALAVITNLRMLLLRFKLENTTGPSNKNILDAMELIIRGLNEGVDAESPQKYFEDNEASLTKQLGILQTERSTYLQKFYNGCMTILASIGAIDKVQLEDNQKKYGSKYTFWPAEDVKSVKEEIDTVKGTMRLR